MLHWNEPIIKHSFTGRWECIFIYGANILIEMGISHLEC